MALYQPVCTEYKQDHCNTLTRWLSAYTHTDSLRLAPVSCLWRKSSCLNPDTPPTKPWIFNIVLQYTKKNSDPSLKKQETVSLQWELKITTTPGMNWIPIFRWISGAGLVFSYFLQKNQDVSLFVCIFQLYLYELWRYDNKYSITSHPTTVKND